MRTSGPGPVKEDYLRAMYLFAEKGIEHIPLVDIANSLKLSKSTVTERIQELARDGFVVQKKYAPVEFTKRGLATAKKLTYKHRLIEVFLHKTLGMHTSKIHDEAHRLEHAVSDEVAELLSKFLNNPESDPHGSKIIK